MITRRELLQLSGLAAASCALPAPAQESAAPDHTLEIAPLTLEVAPRHRIRTVGYNGQVPGPLLRLREGRTVTIEVVNRTEHLEVVHWHGLFTDVAADGAIEEGTPPVEPGSRRRYRFEPRPAGFRWYHTHTMAMGDLTRGQYSGQHGFLLVEPASAPGRYDQEIFLALHDWEGYLTASDDGSMNPAYRVSTINGRMMGAGEPVTVRQGQRILLHVLNSSPTEVHWLALAGHTLRVVALDGNPVPAPRSVAMLRLAPGERVCCEADMSNPGVWVLGEVRRHVRAAGMGLTIEYAGSGGAPQWQQPQELVFSYGLLAGAPSGKEAGKEAGAAAGEPPVLVPLVIEPRFRGHGGMEGWTLNGRSYPDSHVAPLQRGRRHRLQFINRSADDHPLHVHRHSFELVSEGAPLDGGALAPTGLMKDVVLVNAMTRTEVELLADHPGPTLLHCHQQDHMDNGFMVLLNYA
jgi:FtsP/CotA-like multicopper oxidase with cupredoxin domain